MSVPFSNAALKTELLTDPASLGYAPHITAGDDNGLADLINMARSGGAYLVNRDPVTPGRLFAQIDPTEYAGLTTTNLQRLATAFAVPTLDLSVSNVLGILTGVFPNGSLTNQAIVTLSKRAGSRAEVLWGPGVIVNANIINTALHE